MEIHGNQWYSFYLVGKNTLNYLFGPLNPWRAFILNVLDRARKITPICAPDRIKITDQHMQY